MGYGGRGATAMRRPRGARRFARYRPVLPDKFSDGRTRRWQDTDRAICLISDEGMGINAQVVIDGSQDVEVMNRVTGREPRLICRWSR